MPTFDPCAADCTCETCMAKNQSQPYPPAGHCTMLPGPSGAQQAKENFDASQRTEPRRFTAGGKRGITTTMLEEPEQSVVDIPDARLALEFDLPPILDRRAVEELVLNAFASGYVSATLTGQGCPYDQAQKQRFEKVKCFAHTLRKPKVRVVPSKTAQMQQMQQQQHQPAMQNLLAPSRFASSSSQSPQSLRVTSPAPPPPVEFFNRFKQARTSGGHMHTGTNFAPVPPPPAGFATPMSELDFTSNK